MDGQHMVKKFVIYGKHYKISSLTFWLGSISTLTYIISYTCSVHYLSLIIF